MKTVALFSKLTVTMEIYTVVEVEILIPVIIKSVTFPGRTYVKFCTSLSDFLKNVFSLLRASTT
jgi:hypothetical protein